MASSHDLIVSASRYEVVRYMTVASATFLVYDWLILFSDEVELIWKRRLSPTKVLYLLSRYLPFFDTTLCVIYYTHPSILPSTCRWNYSAAVWSTAFGMGLAELVLCVRTYAIYGRSRKILWTLSILWTCWFFGNIPVMWAFNRSLSYDERPVPEMVGCYLGHGSPIVFGSFASLLFFEIFIVVLTLRKGLQHLRRAELNRNRTVVILYRDGVVFFVIMALSSLANALLMALAQKEYLDLLDTFLRISHALLCCRILLNLRRAASGPLEGNESVISRHDLAFQRPPLTITTANFSDTMTGTTATIAGDSIVMEALQLKSSDHIRPPQPIVGQPITTSA